MMVFTRQVVRCMDGEIAEGMYGWMDDYMSGCMIRQMYRWPCSALLLVPRLSLPCLAMPYIALHWAPLLCLWCPVCLSLSCAALPCSSMPWLPYTALRCSALSCPALRYPNLPYVVLPCASCLVPCLAVGRAFLNNAF